MFVGLLFAIAVNGWHQQPTMADLDQLVGLYHELHLPFPPADAPLSDTGYRSGGKGLTLSDCSYSVGQNKHGWYDVIQGTERDEQPRPPKPIASDEKTFESLEGYDIEPEFRQPNAALAIAAIEAERGHRQFALAILTHWATKKPAHEESVRGIGAMREKLIDLALNHWLNEFLDVDTDPALIHAEISILTARFDDKDEFRLKEFLADLDFTIKNRYHGDDHTEQLIDALCSGKANGMRFDGRGVVFTERDYDNVIALAHEGYKAIPNLIRHFDDKRLIRLRYGRTRRGSAQPQLFETVGDACRALTSQFAGDRPDWPQEEKIRTWWASAQKASDRDNCWAVISKNEEFIPEAPIRYAEVHFPEMLLKAVKKR